MIDFCISDFTSKWKFFCFNFIACTETLKEEVLNFCFTNWKYFNCYPRLCCFDHYILASALFDFPHFLTFNLFYFILFFFLSIFNPQLNLNNLSTKEYHLLNWNIFPINEKNIPDFKGRIQCFKKETQKLTIHFNHIWLKVKMLGCVLL